MADAVRNTFNEVPVRMVLPRSTPPAIIALVLACCVSTACDDPKSPTAPSAGGRSAVSLAPFDASVTFGPTGAITYRVVLTLRETAGVSATISSVTITLVEHSGVRSTTLVPPADAFQTTTVAGNGTLTSNAISVYGPPLFDLTACCPRYTVGQIVARVTFTDANGNDGIGETAIETGFDLTGQWTGGPISLRAPGDWSAVRVSLTQAQSGLRGEMVSRDGNALMLNGSLSRDGANLSIEGACGSASGGVGLTLRVFEFSGGRVQRMSGTYLGRCFGTVAGSLELRREG